MSPMQLWKMNLMSVGAVCAMALLLLLLAGCKGECWGRCPEYKVAVLELARAKYKCTEPKVTSFVETGNLAYQFSVDACGTRAIYECGKFCDDCTYRCREAKHE